MAETKTAKRTDDTKVWTDEERAAMQEHAKEMKAKRGKSADGEADVLAKIAEMPPADKVMAEKFHAIVTATAPDLMPKTWYGMPAYARDGKLICFFQAAAKFKARYATFGFEEHANLDEGNLWPTSFALKKLGPAEEERIVALVKKAIS
jgi:uncharacterized protein YdhG (YjbR/CyaY superfamily)